LGLIKPTYGNILSDGEDISNHISSWQQITGFVPQNVYIMDDTLENNISMLGEKNKINQNKIYEIINKVNLVDFLNHLPKKENTILGEVGQRISGGQKQRIGIARAIYSDPQILILDESTSNLDNDTENQILRELKMLTKNLTIIIVSHRENIKNYCDTVYTLENQNIKKIK
jgi:ABC-type bacteriocin/lantibiotic exporter with double-glycine peptidase domain